MRIDLNKTIDSVIIICAAIFLIPSTSFAQEDCTPGDMRVCASAYGLVSIQHCIGNNNAAKRICTVEDARYNNIGAEYMACNCGGNSYCLCQPTGACCAMENMGGAPTIEITDGCCGTACFKGQWDECEPIEPPDPDECDEDTIGNPTNVITGNVTYSVNNADVEIHDGNDLLSIWRKYSSQAAMPQSTNTSASLATINWPYLWSPGWSYSFAYTLAYRENNGSGDTLFLRYPNFKTEVLAGSTV
ncbi:MAG: hypothetical protein JW841_11860, partial [Deltaproteobacteria bacterium]|nr:hypothetical protein [Deltaproteobacteria bacterium]